MATSTLAKTTLKSKVAWNNSNPTEAFGAQTISTGFSNIKGITIRYREYATTTREFNVTIFGDESRVDGKLDGFTFTSTPYVYYLRPFIFIPSNGDVSFQLCYPMTAFGSYGNGDNSYAVPTQIIVYY